MDKENLTKLIQHANVQQQRDIIHNMQFLGISLTPGVRDWGQGPAAVPMPGGRSVLHRGAQAILEVPPYGSDLLPAQRWPLSLYSGVTPSPYESDPRVTPHLGDFFCPCKDTGSQDLRSPGSWSW